MTQQDLATAVGYKSRSAINKIEQGLRGISSTQIEGFARALDTTPLYLLGIESYESAEMTQAVKKLLSMFSQLSPKNQATIVRYAKGLLREQSKT